MNKAIIMAKIKRQQAELGEIIAEISKDRRLANMLQILQMRYKETEQLLEAMGEKSYMPRGIEDLDALDEIKRTGKKIDKIKTGIKRMKHLEKEKRKIEKKLK